MEELCAFEKSASEKVFLKNFGSSSLELFNVAEQFQYFLPPGLRLILTGIEIHFFYLCLEAF